MPIENYLMLLNYVFGWSTAIQPSAKLAKAPQYVQRSFCFIEGKSVQIVLKIPYFVHQDRESRVMID